MRFMFFSLSLLMSTTVMAAGYQDTVDEDGCWDAQTRFGDRCVVVDNAEWGGMDGDKLIVRYRNRCDNRVYMSKCNEYESGDWSCGADGVNGHGTSVWSTHDASGDYEWVTVGSAEPGNDWVCAGKHPQWDDIGN